MDRLPRDCLGVIAGLLDARSQAYFAATCRATRDAARDAPITGILTIQNSRALRPWLMARGERVRRLVMKRTAYGAHPWLACLPNLVALRLLYCRVTIEYVHDLPAGLRFLEIHQLRPFGTPAPWTFDPICFAAPMPALEDLRVTLTTRWMFVIVDDTECRLQNLVVRATAPNALAFVHRVPAGLSVQIKAARVWHSVLDSENSASAASE